MTTIFGDKVTLQRSGGSAYSFNDAATLAVSWPGAVKMACDEIDGWKDTVSLDVISVPRGIGDGNYTAARFPSQARMLTIGGYIVCPNRATLDSLLDLLVIQAFPEDVDIKLTRFEPVPKYVTGRLADKVLVTQYMPAEGQARWETMLLCSDPFKYDAVNVLTGTTGIAGVTTGGRTYPRVYPLVYTSTSGGTGNAITVTNIGTARTYPVITIVGPVNSGWRVENSTTGDTMGFEITLTTGDILVIDSQNKFATLNGSPVNGLLNGDWWSLARGTNVVRLFGDYNATATFSISGISRWR